MIRVVLMLVFLVGGASSARAEDLATLRAGLHDADEAKAVKVALKLAEDTSPAATEAMLDELAIGGPPKVLAELLTGLATRKDPRTFDVLLHFTRNRSSLVRKRAVSAIAQLGDPRVVNVLVGALGDTVADVRAAAAKALAARQDKAPGVEEALFKLLAHKDDAAVTPLGTLGGPATARKLGELEGVPDGLVARTFNEFLGRTDFGPDPLRTQVVIALGRLHCPEATEALTEYVKSTETEKDRPSRREAQDILDKRGGNAK